MSAPILFQPSMPQPRPPITKEVRIEKLKELLKKVKEEEKTPPKYHFLQSQAVNIEKLISMYENDEIKLGQDAWLINGRVVKEEDKDQEGEGPRWHEHGADQYYHQMAQKHAYGHGPYPTSHEILARMRLMLTEGGDGQWFYIQMMNDTGSDIMTFFDTDFAMLGDLTFYHPYRGWVEIVDASGLEQWLLRFRVEVQLVRENGDPWGPSFVEWIVPTAHSSPIKLPTRVLKIEQERGYFKVRLHEGSGEKVRYATLSHFWGEFQPLSTTKRNLSDRLKEMKWPSLPQALQDAVIINHGLGIHCLWIDSLCIIQNSKDDWETEAAQMKNM
ncbi:hypothetical protein OIDMADRAFT_174054 [Oidiodendron maius Zn]|uniref:Heterokaryon incompatibility domain-containing protein n=1 Tax=Oidiodendron maius (strain Zn) TaxID=913774 RepID=A0A0C3HFG8_OIDMZ|nr:hypothetical protein OIDMADRAFT_174054 [Oidiodendron maius Zn]